MIKWNLSECGFVYRRPGEELKQGCVSQRTKHPLQLMIWAVVNEKGLGALHFVDGNMDGKKYAKLVDDVIAPQMTKWFRRRKNYLFMHDLAPCHRSKVAKDRFTHHKINLLEWPSNAPDMNPIENVWKSLKLRVRKVLLKWKSSI
jgi:hypothetical protein